MLYPAPTTTDTTRVCRPFDALLLAGFTGWGNPRVHGLPLRPLAPVALRPLVTYPLEWFARHGATLVTICGHGSAEPLQRRLGTQYGATDLRYVQDQMPRGPAGCIRDAAVEGSDKPLVVAEGSVLPTLCLDELLEAHRRTGAAMTIVAKADGRGLIRPAGIYVVERRALAHIPRQGFLDIKEALVPRLHAAGELVTVHQPGDIGRRVGNLETYLLANYWVLDRMARTAPLDDRQARRSLLAAHPTARIADGATLIGDIAIGAGAHVDAQATIVGPAVIGVGSTIERGALVSRSVIGDGCVVAGGAVVHGSFVADQVQVGRGDRLYRSARTTPRTHPAWWQRWFATSDTVPLTRPAAPLGADAAESGATTCT